MWVLPVNRKPPLVSRKAFQVAQLRCLPKHISEDSHLQRATNKRNPVLPNPLIFLIFETNR